MESNRQSNIMMLCPSMMDPPILVEIAERAQIAGSTIIRVLSTVDTWDIYYRIGLECQQRKKKKQRRGKKEKLHSSPHHLLSFLLRQKQRIPHVSPCFAIFRFFLYLSLHLCECFRARWGAAEWPNLFPNSFDLLLPISWSILRESDLKLFESVANQNANVTS